MVPPPTAAPQLEEFFERGSALKLARRRHPYDFAETYQLLREAYGYASHYVNLGLWRAELVPDSGGMDPGTRLVALLANHSDVAPGARLLDVGSGLGQGALDLRRWLHAREVTGINTNPRQLRFANALAAAAGEEHCVRHLEVDACAGLERAFAPGSFDGAFAVECVGHFADPGGFLDGVGAVLAPGAPLLLCLNVAKAPLPLGFQAFMRMGYGFVPRPLSDWTELLARQGFTVTQQGDLTDPVLRDGAAHVLARLQLADVQARVPWAARQLVRRQLSSAASAVQRGLLGYHWFSCRRG